jgi:hypothetical protein
MRDKPAKEKRLPNNIHSDLAPIFLRVHTRVVNEKPRKDGE